MFHYHIFDELKYEFTVKIGTPMFQSSWFMAHGSSFHLADFDLI